MLITVFTRVLVDPVYKSTPNFLGQKLDFLNFQVRVSWKTYLVFLRILFQLLRICEQITASFNIMARIRAFLPSLATCVYAGNLTKIFVKWLQNQT